MIGWFIGLGVKFKVAASFVGIALLAIGVSFLKGRREGIRVMEAEQQRRRDKLQEHYDEIDRQPVDPDSSYQRLRRLRDE